MLHLIFWLASVGIAQCTPSTSTFLPPSVEPFIHINLLVGLPANTSTPLGTFGRAPNVGGNVTGAIEGEIVPLGAAEELVPIGVLNHSVGALAPSTPLLSTDIVPSQFYTNHFTINTTVSDLDETRTVIMKASAVIQYANAALYGLASVRFEAAESHFGNLSYRSFVGQVSADFVTGQAVLDVFELHPVGRVDGEPIPGLDAPGTPREE